MSQNQSLESRVTALEVQVNRIISDIESEKRVRAEVNLTLFGKIEKLRDNLSEHAKYIYIGMGGLGALELILRLAGK